MIPPQGTNQTKKRNLEMGRLLWIFWVELCNDKGPYKREELLSKNELGFDELGNSQPLQISKDAKIRRAPVRKTYSSKKDSTMSRQPLASASNRSKGKSN